MVAVVTKYEYLQKKGHEGMGCRGAEAFFLLWKPVNPETEISFFAL